VRRKSAESKVRKPPDHKPVNGENSSNTKKKIGNTKVETGTVTPVNSPLVKEKSSNFKVEPSKRTEVNGDSFPQTRKKSPHTKVEADQRAEVNEENFPFAKKRSVNSKVEAIQKSVNNNVEVTPGPPIWEDRLSGSSHHDDSSSGSRRVSESSQKSSDVSARNSRTSSFTGSDIIKTTTVRHVGSTPSAGGGERIEKRRAGNAEHSKDSDERQVGIVSTVCSKEKVAF
jgi:hypothetical protein